MMLDEVDFYVPGILANDAMQSVNFLLCFVENTNFQTFVDQGVYKALLMKLNVRTASGIDAAEAAAATGTTPPMVVEVLQLEIQLIKLPIRLEFSKLLEFWILSVEKVGWTLTYMLMTVQNQ